MSDISGPVELSDFFSHTSPNVVHAYKRCRAVEKDVMERGESERDLVDVRILGYLLVFAPTDAALAHVTAAINSTAGDDASLIRLGSFYDDYWIRTYMLVSSFFLRSKSLVWL